jgi:hypothetical protein
MSHQNDGSCSHCQLIFDDYPGFDPGIRAWFIQFQKTNPNWHISCAGRGRDEQEKCFNEKTSRAHWGESAHNYNCAIDTFQLVDGVYVLDKQSYLDLLAPKLPKWIEWGYEWKSFPELPHLQRRNFKFMNLKLVE